MRASRKRVTRAIAIALLLSAWSSSVMAQEAGPADAPGFLHRDYLLGDLGGARQRLEAKGFTYDVTYTFDSLWNVRGGARTGYAYRGDLSIALDLDTAAAGLWKNGHFAVVLQGEHGEGPTGRYVGDAQGVSNIEADDFAHVAEFWYEQTFAAEKLRIKFGKMDTNADFAFRDYGGGFNHSSAGFGPTIPLVTYPDQDLALFIAYQPVEALNLKLGVMQARPKGSRPLGDVFGDFRGPMIMFEPEIHYTLRKHPGTFRPGFWWNGDTVPLNAPEEDGSAGIDPLAQLELFQTVQSDGLGRTFLSGLIGQANGQITDVIVGKLLDIKTSQNDTSGFYFTWDQEVYRENPEQDNDAQGIGIFAQGGWSSGETSAFTHYFGAGLEWTGPFSSRDEDVLGLGIFHAVFSPKLDLPEGTETAIELYYRAALTPWLSVKPLITYVNNPGGSEEQDAVVLGLRGQITF